MYALGIMMISSGGSSSPFWLLYAHDAPISVHVLWLQRLGSFGSWLDTFSSVGPLSGHVVRSCLIGVLKGLRSTFR